MDKPKPQRIMYKTIMDNVKISLCKAYILYDIIAECKNIEKLKKIKKQYRTESEIFEKGVI